MNQSKALAILKSGRNVFLTGSAGAGKTYVLNQYITYLKEHKIPVATTASTGIAATHMNGQTIHSWSGIGIKDEISYKQMSNLKEKKYFRDKMDNVKVLIVDEISMLHRNQLELVNRVLKFFKENELAFGGIQVIFSGDFFQLPPIGNQEETSRQKFAFMSDAWLEAEPVICYLTEQHRQSENDLNSILNEIRNGEVSQRSIDLLESRVEFHPDEGEQETKLFTHNADVERINKAYLEQIGSSSKFFPAMLKGNDGLLEILKRSVLAPENLELKTGAQVMFIKNNYEVGYVNGTLGRVTGFTDKGNPLVKTLDNDLIEAKVETWAIEDETGKPLASFVQIPLRLAWAITVHKSQGMTMDAAMIDLSRAFEKGQGYVALSRLRDLSGLKLRGLNQTALEVDKLAMRADFRFRELSQEWDDSLDEKDLENEFIGFIVHCGGITDKKELAKQKEKLTQKGKAEKVSTYQLTKKLVEEKLTIDQMAERRGLGKGTILSHLIHIAEIDKEIDLDIYRPSEVIFEKVKAAAQKQAKEEKTSLAKIYAELKNEVSFDEIKQSMIFLVN
ncbi:AAA family ATPase [Moheibacter sediminis]|uniref:Helix-turn-helix domain-containing protein n=1 Tax=Moheibacter sediminis TaxID=1434700 RepID=A0A1W2AFR9_9FLAO|nr:AAA family ATPase [Moheibacter sediminis]SMC59430.1 Helix-turn-helix domain-containing protein [Moheibacter sediminis]